VLVAADICARNTVASRLVPNVLDVWRPLGSRQYEPRRGQRGQLAEFRYEESPELKLAVDDVLLAKDGNTLGIVNIVRRFLSQPQLMAPLPFCDLTLSTLTSSVTQFKASQFSNSSLR
jgi:hypothetical protein